jgi:NAD(P)-dependent dehydrogenase (short-subunit alcohol dehydrogenase family)
MKLNGKRAIITGGASGIGLGIGTLFGAEGARVVLADINGDAAESAAQKLGNGAFGVAVDVSNVASVTSMVATAKDRLGGVDILVNCAGIGNQATFLYLPFETWEKMIGINLTGTFLCSQAVAREMVAGGGGSIINIASISGVRAGTGRTAYGTTKAGIIHLTRQIAIELASRGVRANTISPGPIDTPLARQAHTPIQRERYCRQIPMGRYGEISEIADAAVFLASAESSYINGHNLVVDGGFCIGGLLTPEDQE